ncbi:ABC-type transport auxiliary lipoprotein family protein [Roseateles cellulosilyticus]|uniref:PqiC family protein n=1 Tax=Pelomonas cellulosilytica TaxID=2906762 RepID=A0ABS8XVE3_9BURK|nr:ABC-type transport auxiliary lipoprotein family protein [Pelomonas sp. P8]MCE4554601.1 PqiC family protein [Pelomonas sp. P8]
MRFVPALLLCTAALAGCSLAPTVPPRAVYDLGPAPTIATATTPGAVAWRIADVTAPPWLDGDGIAYRLAFQQAQRQEHYRDSVWAAPPAALLTQRLHETVATAAACPEVSANATRPVTLLTVNLDQFEQLFSSPSGSQAVLRVHATLWPAGALGATQQQLWRLERPTTPDAAGAARGLAQAVDDWLPQLAAWLVSNCPK